MLCNLVRLVKQVQRVVVRTVSALARTLGRRARRAWNVHRERVATDPGYAALTAMVVGGLLGTVPFTEVFAAVLVAVLGVCTNATGPGRGRVTGTGTTFGISPDSPVLPGTRRLIAAPWPTGPGAFHV